MMLPYFTFPYQFGIKLPFPSHDPNVRLETSSGTRRYDANGNPDPFGSYDENGNLIPN